MFLEILQDTELDWACHVINQLLLFLDPPSVYIILYFVGIPPLDPPTKYLHASWLFQLTSLLSFDNVISHITEEMMQLKRVIKDLNKS